MNGDPRFVILTHDHPFLHWDLMLEEGDALTTYRLLQEPAVGVEISAEPLAAHRKAYLDYEGPVSGDRGSVSRWDHGTYRIVARDESTLLILIDGLRLPGQAEILRDGNQVTCRFASGNPKRERGDRE